VPGGWTTTLACALYIGVCEWSSILAPARAATVITRIQQACFSRNRGQEPGTAAPGSVGSQRPWRAARPASSPRRPTIGRVAPAMRSGGSNLPGRPPCPLPVIVLCVLTVNLHHGSAVWLASPACPGPCLGAAKARRKKKASAEPR